MSIITRQLGTFVIKNTRRVPRCFLTRCAGMPPQQARVHNLEVQGNTTYTLNTKERTGMKATGIVRRIDDLGRVVIPKEIRRTLRIREGDPLEIYTEKDGEVIFKKYSLMGGVDEFAAQLCDTLSKSTGTSVAVTDRDSVIAAAGSARRDLIGKRISPQLEQIMEDRGIYRAVPSERSVFVTESLDRYCATIAAPIISEGDALGLVVFIGTEGESAAGETEYKLAQAIAGFLGKHMES